MLINSEKIVLYIVLVVPIQYLQNLFHIEPQTHENAQCVVLI